MPRGPVPAYAFVDVALPLGSVHVGEECECHTGEKSLAFPPMPTSPEAPINRRKMAEKVGEGRIGQCWGGHLI